MSDCACGWPESPCLGGDTACPAYPGPASVSPADTPAHVHEWSPGGTVREPYTIYSPVRASDHYHGTRTYQVMVCACGKVKRVLVGES